MVKNLPADAGDLGSILGSGRSPGKGNGNLLHDPFLENPMQRGAWRATVHEVTRRLGHDRARTSQKKKGFFFSSEVLFYISTPHCGGVKEVGKRRNETVNSTHWLFKFPNSVCFSKFSIICFLYSG